MNFNHIINRNDVALHYTSSSLSVQSSSTTVMITVYIIITVPAIAITLGVVVVVVVLASGLVVRMSSVTDQITASHNIISGKKTAAAASDIVWFEFLFNDEWF